MHRADLRCSVDAGVVAPDASSIEPAPRPERNERDLVDEHVHEHAHEIGHLDSGPTPAPPQNLGLSSGPG